MKRDGEDKTTRATGDAIRPSGPLARTVALTLCDKGAVQHVLEGALSGHPLGVEEFVARCVIALDGDFALAKCEAASVVKALLACAAMGVVPATRATPQTRREVSLVPRAVTLAKDENGRATAYRMVCDITPEWRWFKRQFELHPDVLRAESAVVMEGDRLERQDGGWWRNEVADPFALDKIVLGPVMDVPWGKGTAKAPQFPGLRGVLVTLWKADGQILTHLVGVDGVRKAFLASEAGANGPWRDWTGQMVRKTGYRSAASADLVDMSGVPQLAAFLAFQANLYQTIDVEASPVLRSRAAAALPAPQGAVSLDLSGAPVAEEAPRPSGPRASARRYGAS